VRVDAHQLLSEAAQYAVDLRDVTAKQKAAKRALEVACGGRPQYFNLSDRQARQDHARQAHSHDFAPNVAGRKLLRPRAFIVSLAC